jgi:hypothetical protein
LAYPVSLRFVCCVLRKHYAGREDVAPSMWHYKQAGP